MLKTPGPTVNSSRPSISVVIPSYNERATLTELCTRLTRVLNDIALMFEIILVDDGSDDGSIEVVRSLRKVDSNIRYIRFRRNFGKSAALAAGFRAAQHPIVITMDADLQDLPEQLPFLVEKLNDGFDLVSGWRYKRRDKLTKRLASRFYNWTTAKLTGVRLHDINCGFKCYRKEVLSEVLVYGERHRYIPVLASYRGFLLEEVKIDHAERKYGISRFGWSRVIGGGFSLLTVILLTRYTGKPLHFFGLFGTVLFSIGFFIDAYLLLQRLLQNIWLGNRPLLIIGTLFITVGIQFILFGLLAEMIAFTSNREADYAIVETSEDLQIRKADTLSTREKIAKRMMEQ
jgi:glycosyltransferase involved in cell wall biosynthesis